jgi:predicted secreted Zn-dependent protease
MDAQVASRRAAGLLLALASLPVAAGDSLSVEYFDIQGATARELREELSRLGPVADNGIRGDAFTRWQISWKFDLTERDKACIAGNFAVDLTVTMFLPRWVPPADASAELIALWDRYSAAVRFHEDGHHRIALAAGQEVMRRLNAESRGQGCKALENRLKAVVDEVLIEYRARQADYDRETDSGRAQGTNIL